MTEHVYLIYSESPGDYYGSFQTLQGVTKSLKTAFKLAKKARNKPKGEWTRSVRPGTSICKIWENDSFEAVYIDKRELLV